MAVSPAQAPSAAPSQYAYSSLSSMQSMRGVASSRDGAQNNGQYPPQPPPGQSVPSYVPPEVLETPNSLPVTMLADRYIAETIIGKGAYGTVVSALDRYTGERVAVKRISRVMENYPTATRVLRELKLLRILREHENIISVRDVLIPDMHEKFQDVFVVFDLFPTDLGRLLVSKTELRWDHTRFIMFQLLDGIDFLHRARVFHRDLKPSNILINAKCQLRICDFGLARAAFPNQPELIFWTDYVATRWYRAPELILAHVANYSTAIDIWSVGCIFVELLRRGRPLFPGKNAAHQFDLITQVTGTPSLEVIHRLRTPQAREMVLTLPKRDRMPLKALLPHADAHVLALLERMLAFDPRERISAADALESECFRELWPLRCERCVPAPMLESDDFVFERNRYNEDKMREEFRKEVRYFQPADSVSTPSTYAVTSNATRLVGMVDRIESEGDFRPYHTMPTEKLKRVNSATRAAPLPHH